MTTVTVDNAPVQVQVIDEVVAVDVTTSTVDVSITNSIHYTDTSTAIQPYLAGATLSALKAVYADVSGDVLAADSSNLATSNVVGVTKTSASIGASIDVVTYGALNDALWSWTVGQLVYVGAAGALTQTPPTTGYVCQVGIAVKTTQVNINLQQIVILG